MSAFKTKLNDTSLFRKLYIVDLFCCVLSFIQVPAYVFLVFLFVWGLRLVYINQKRYGTFFKMRFGLWIGAFLVFSLLSILINFSYTVLFSLVMFLHVMICFFIFYGMHTEPDFNFKEELYSLSVFFVYVTTVLNIIGIFSLLFGINYSWEFFNVYKVCFPIFENRLTGLYYNPNLLGFVSVAAIFCCHILAKSGLYRDIGKSPFPKLMLAVCIITNVFSLILCDSNAAFVLGMGYALTYLVYIFFDRREGISPSIVFIRVITLLIAGTILVTSALMFRTIFKAGFAAITAKTNSMVEALWKEDEIIKEIEEDAPKDNGVTFNHENKNIDSGRFRLWKESLDLFKISPIIGIANGNIVFYSEEYLNGTLSYSYHNSDLHNGYLTIIVSTGVIGGLLFGTFAFRFVKHAAQHLFLRRKTVRDEVYPCLFSFLCSYMVYSLFERALLYDISFMVMFFWLVMGYTSCYVAKYEHLIETQYLFRRRRIKRTLL